MPEALAAAWATPGLVWVALAAFVAGVVRGFAGFGTAMIFLPVAGQFLSPVNALVALVVMDIVGPLPMLPRAWRDGHPKDVARLIAGLVVTLPIGVMLLLMMEPTVFRTAVSIVALVLVACLILGLRYRGQLHAAMVYAIGGVSGILGGATGVPGPPVILFYMASPLPASAVRANNTMFLFLFDFAFLAILALRGQLTAEAMAVGVFLMVPAVLGIIAGSAIFRPGAERFYRAAAYVIITVSALSGLPFWR